ncbi:MAG: glycogen debranching enzyme family protein [Bacteroidales bacterium]|nr:glycogen debranching enzyme family protein [Bacteroidales bacterium]
MAYIEFDKTMLVNLEYSLGKEILRTSRSGSYSSTTIVGCNTRKYHGLLVCPVDAFGGERYVLLSSFDVSVVEGGKLFNLGIHKFDGDHFSPKGHKYLKDYTAELIPAMSYEVGTVKLRQERLLSDKSDQLMIRYTIEESQEPVSLQFRPLLAFRNMHELTMSNMHANTRVKYIDNGIKMRMYEGFPYLCMQFSKKPEFVKVPDWLYGIEYLEEQKRGYDFREDLFIPGYFELSLSKGESVVFSASTEETNPTGLKARFSNVLKTKVPRDSFRNCLLNAAQQFIVERNKRTDIIAGYHWFGSWGRDTFISLPGLTLSRGDLKTCREVLDTQTGKMKDGLFPNMGEAGNYAFNSVDAPLWFIWAVQQYINAGGKDGWTRYGDAVVQVIKAYISGTDYNIGMHDNGLIYAGTKDKALTWMDAVISTGPVTPRTGYNVEINALWYNALCLAGEYSGKINDKEFAALITDLPGKVKSSFISYFWDEKLKYLADYVQADGSRNMFVRPNMLIAASLQYTMLERDMIKSILDVAESELLTERGLRTLAPKNPNYEGVYRGTQEQRDAAYHQGTVWPWLIGPYAEACLRLYGERGLKQVSRIIRQFEDVMDEHGVSTISEVYDGDPPHMPGGAISQAWSVAEILRIIDLMDQVSVKKKFTG